jgi:hypothetical protein
MKRIRHRWKRLTGKVVNVEKSCRLRKEKVLLEWSERGKQFDLC